MIDRDQLPEDAADWSRITYVLVQADTKENTQLGLNEANGLSLEQFILASYHDEVYWS